MPSSNGLSNPGLTAILSTFVSVHSHEVSTLLHSSSCFFFILSAYFVVLPLRDEGAISLGLSNLPGLFIGSLALTLVAAPLSTLAFSLPNYSKARVLLLMHRFFSISLVVFFFLWHSSSGAISPFKAKGTVSLSSELKNDLQVNSSQIDCPADSGSKVGCPSVPSSWSDHGWFYIFVRIAFFLWIALMNLITISSTWARVIDVMDSESGSRLFGFIGAGATLGQLFGSLFATGMAWLGPYLLLFAALLMEFAAQSSKGIKKDSSEHPEELLQASKANSDEQDEKVSLKKPSPKSPIPTPTPKPQLSTILDGFRLIVSSTYLSYVSIFLWLSAVVSSFFYFQKVNVIATAVTSSVGRRRMFAQINSFIAVFILAGQLTLTGRILMTAGVTVAICSAPAIAFGNLVVIAVWPTWIAVAICETMRKVVTYVVARPGRELLFTVVSEEEKYKAKLCIDVVVQRLGDATAAGMYKLLFSTLHGRASTVSLYALPVCVVWIVIAFHLGRRQAQLAKLQDV